MNQAEQQLLRKLPGHIQVAASGKRNGKHDRIKRAAMHEASEIVREFLKPLLEQPGTLVPVVVVPEHTFQWLHEPTNLEEVLHRLEQEDPA
jgi:hypothetical protein